MPSRKARRRAYTRVNAPSTITRRYICGPAVSVFALLGRVPPADVRHERVRFFRSPRARLVVVHRAWSVNHRIDDGPGRLDDVLPREERRVAGDRVAEQPLVRLHAA